MPVNLNFTLTNSGNEKADRFMILFEDFIDKTIVGNSFGKSVVLRELTPIIRVENGYVYSTLYDSYKVFMGRYFNRLNPKSGDAKWLADLGKGLKDHDNKFVPKYRELKDKIEKVSKFNLPSNPNPYAKETKQIQSVKREASDLFLKAWLDLYAVFTKARKKANTMQENYEYKNGNDKKTYKNLVYICKENINNLIANLSYSQGTESTNSLYVQLGIPGCHGAQANREIIASKSDDANTKNAFEKRLNFFKNHLTGQGDNPSDKNLAPILLKRKSGHSMSISGRFSDLFSEFINRGKGSKTSHTAKWCRSFLEDIEKHEKNYVQKYKKLREEIKALLTSKPDDEGEEETSAWQNKNDAMKDKAIKLFADARKSLQGVLDRAAKSARRTLVRNSTVYAKRDDVKALADEFRRVEPDNDALWNTLTKKN